MRIFWRHLRIFRGGSNCDATIKAGAANEELSLLILTSTYVEAASPILAPCAHSFISHVVTLSQVLHIAQDDLFNYYTMMQPLIFIWCEPV